MLSLILREEQMYTCIVTFAAVVQTCKPYCLVFLIWLYLMNGNLQKYIQQCISVNNNIVSELSSKLETPNLVPNTLLINPFHIDRFLYPTEQPISPSWAVYFSTQLSNPFPLYTCCGIPILM